MTKAKRTAKTISTQTCRHTSIYRGAAALRETTKGSLSLWAQNSNVVLYEVFTRSSKRPANFQQMYSKCTCFAGSCKHPISLSVDRIFIFKNSDF